MRTGLITYFYLTALCAWHLVANCCKTKLMNELMNGRYERGKNLRRQAEYFKDVLKGQMEKCQVDAFFVRASPSWEEECHSQPPSPFSAGPFDTSPSIPRILQCLDPTHTLLEQRKTDPTNRIRLFFPLFFQLTEFLSLEDYPVNIRCKTITLLKG